MGWQNVIAIALGTIIFAYFAKMYTQLKDNQKKLIDLEYKNAKSEIKDKVKNDSADTVFARIKARFGFRDGSN